MPDCTSLDIERAAREFARAELGQAWGDVEQLASHKGVHAQLRVTEEELGFERDKVRRLTAALETLIDKLKEVGVVP